MFRQFPKSFETSILNQPVAGMIPLSDTMERFREEARRSVETEQDLGLPKDDLLLIAQTVIGHDSLSIEESATSLREQRLLLQRAGILHTTPVDVVVDPGFIEEKCSLASILPIAINGEYLPLVIPHERADNKGTEFRDMVEEHVRRLYSTTATQKVSEALHTRSQRSEKTRSWAVASTAALVLGGLGNLFIPGTYEAYLKLMTAHAEAVAKAENDRRSGLVKELYTTHAMLVLDQSKAAQLLQSVGWEHYDALAATLTTQPKTVETLGPVLRDLARAELLLKRAELYSKVRSDFFDYLFIKIIKEGNSETAREVASILNEISKK
jgi:hypothetical protein